LPIPGWGHFGTQAFHKAALPRTQTSDNLLRDVRGDSFLSH
jgi:hypothetical protein